MDGCVSYVSRDYQRLHWQKYSLSLYCLTMKILYKKFSDKWFTKSKWDYVPYIAHRDEQINRDWGTVSQYIQMETDRTSEKWLEVKINNDGIYN